MQITKALAICVGVGLGYHAPARMYHGHWALTTQHSWSSGRGLLYFTCSCKPQDPLCSPNSPGTPPPKKKSRHLLFSLLFFLFDRVSLVCFSPWSAPLQLFCPHASLCLQLFLEPIGHVQVDCEMGQLFSGQDTGEQNAIV